MGGIHMRWIEGISKVTEMIGKVCLLIILMVVAIVLVVGLFRLRRTQLQSITIASFTDTNVNTHNEKSSGLGDEIADTLESEVIRIAQLHTLTNPWGSPKELPALQMAGPQTVERVGGTIKFAGLELPVEVVVEILKPLLARPRTQYLITGNFQQFLPTQGPEEQESGTRKKEDDCRRFPPGDGTRMYITIHLEADGRMLQRWSCKSLLPSVTERTTEQLSVFTQHLRKIAYEIMWIVLEGVEAKSLDNFRDYIEGVDLFRQYKDNLLRQYRSKRNNKTLDEAETELLNEMFDRAQAKLFKVISENNVYARAYFYLGNLYSWRAYYEEDKGEESRFQYLARSMYTATAKKATLKPYEAEALSRFGLGLIQYRQHIKAKQHKKSLDIQLLESADQDFVASRKHDTRFYFARSGSALVYNEKADLLKEQKDRKQRERYINHAIKELQYAKAAAADLKDTESLKWLDRKILELEFKKRTVDEPESEWQME
jgi:hypothetical protein